MLQWEAYSREGLVAGGRTESGVIPISRVFGTGRWEWLRGVDRITSRASTSQELTETRYERNGISDSVSIYPKCRTVGSLENGEQETKSGKKGMFKRPLDVIE